MVSDVLQILRASCSALLVKEANCTEKKGHDYIYKYTKGTVHCSNLNAAILNRTLLSGGRWLVCLESL